MLWRLSSKASTFTWGHVVVFDLIPFLATHGFTQMRFKSGISFEPTGTQYANVEMYNGAEDYPDIVILTTTGSSGAPTIIELQTCGEKQEVIKMMELWESLVEASTHMLAA